MTYKVSKYVFIMGKKKEEKTPERLAMEAEAYPYYVFFILGNEFCERYAYYGMRSILTIYLVSCVA